jgi:hypothetical protein
MLYCTSLLAYVGAGEGQPASISTAWTSQQNTPRQQCHCPTTGFYLLHGSSTVTRTLRSFCVAHHQITPVFLRSPAPTPTPNPTPPHPPISPSQGDQAFLTPRRLSVVNTSSGSRIRDLSFSQAVLAVRINRQR